MSVKQRLTAGLKAFMHPRRAVPRIHAPEPERVIVDKLLLGKNILVTGVARNIGRSVALEMAKHGANIYGTDLDSASFPALEAEFAQYGGKCGLFKADITKPADTAQLCQSLTEAEVPVDVLVNNVGVGGADWQRVLETNVIGPMHLTTQLSKAMIARGEPASVIFISSIHQDTVYRWAAPYSASKGALSMIIKELALDLAPHRIRVNGIAPGFTEEDEQGVPKPHGFTPLEGSSVSPRYVGRSAVYLASDYFSRHTTGAMITIDGGLSLFNYLCAVEAGLHL